MLHGVRCHLFVSLTIQPLHTCDSISLVHFAAHCDVRALMHVSTGNAGGRQT